MVAVGKLTNWLNWKRGFRLFRSTTPAKSKRCSSDLKEEKKPERNQDCLNSTQKKLQMSGRALTWKSETKDSNLQV